MEKIVINKSTLYVDLDGTYTKSDMLFESLIIAIKNNPLVFFLCLVWLFKGRAHLKYQLSQRANISTKLLPLNPELYKFLLEEKANGRKLILATASNEKYAANICDDFKLFDSYISSDINTNLKGSTKLSKIQSMNEHFSYAGNSSEDFVIFEKCDESYLVNPTKKAKQLAIKSPPTKTLDDSSRHLLVWMKQLRVHQWIKNVLIFVPLIVSGYFLDPDFIMISVLGFLSFSFLASATYIINDLLDLESDRNHFRKKNRPLAAGTISLIEGIFLALILFVLAFTIALILSNLFALVLGLYLVLTLTYSFKLKQHIGMDIVALASLYTIRIIAGAVVLDVIMSFWLLSFSMFIFFSLAIIKRCAELKLLGSTGKKTSSGRDYEVEDYLMLMSVGVSSAMISVLMFCFYVNSNVLADQYQQPTLLWLVVPVLCYWLIRMWAKTHRGMMHDDPIVFSMKDKGSIVTVGFMGLIALLAQIL